LALVGLMYRMSDRNTVFSRCDLAEASITHTHTPQSKIKRSHSIAVVSKCY
jgi:hypothetical protein